MSKRALRRLRRNTFVNAVTVGVICGGAMVASAFMLSAGWGGVVMCLVFWGVIVKVV